MVRELQQSGRMQEVALRVCGNARGEGARSKVRMGGGDRSENGDGHWNGTGSKVGERGLKRELQWG